MSMDFGVMLLTQHSADRDSRTCAEELRSTARLAEDLGYDSLFVGEHHFTEDVYLDNFQVLPHLAAITDEVRIGTAVCLVPLHNPVQLAERLGTLDVLSDGRLIFGGGVGYRQEEFDIMGVPKAERGQRTTETLEIAHRLWHDDGVSYDGRIFDFDGVSINPKPVQDGGPDVWVGGTAPPAIRRAADLGDAWLIDARSPRSDVRDQYAVYEDSLVDRPTERPIRREVYVADTDERARELALPSLSAKYDTYQNWGGGDAMGSADDAFEEFIEDRFVIGSPQTVIEELEGYQEAFDVNHVVMRHRWPGMPVDDAHASIELFADEVIPAF
ncbi:MAG: LLM class flavin-dependent oxidoreductase [Salinirussus sp.]